MVTAFTILGLIAAIVFFTFYEKEPEIFNVLVNSVTSYFFAYIFSSACLVTINMFSLKKTTFLVLGIFIAADICTLIGRKTLPKIRFSLKKFLIPLIASLIVIPFVVLVPFGTFAMGQDEGVYQTEATLYIRGITSNEIDYSEYYSAPVDTEKAQIITAVSDPNVLGVYRSSDDNNLSQVLTGNSDCLSETSGVFHGLHTFSAVLALWGFFFGISNMTGVNLLLLILSVFWVYRICQRLKLNPVLSSIACVIFSLSPQIIWGTKSALTEIGLTLIWTVFIYEIMGKSNREIMLSGIAAGLYGFWHISMYVFMPFFAVMYVFLYFYTSNRTHLKALITVSVMYLAGFWYSLYTACHYTLMNYKPVYHLFINRDNIIYIASAAALLLIAASVVLFVTSPAGKVSVNVKAVSITVRVIAVISFVTIICRFIASEDFPLNWTHVSFISFGILTGFIFLIISTVSILFKTGDWLDSAPKAVLMISFIYSVVFYSAFLKFNSQYFYYYSRYLTMYIFIIVLCGVVALSCVKNLISVTSAVLSLLIIIPNDIYLLKMTDSTRMDWNSLETIEETITNEDCDVVFLQPCLYSLYYYDFKSLGIDVYPVFVNPDETAQIRSMYENALIVDSSSNEAYDDEYDLILRIHVNSSVDLPESPDNFLGLPTDVAHQDYDLSIYSI